AVGGRGAGVGGKALVGSRTPFPSPPASPPLTPALSPGSGGRGSKSCGSAAVGTRLGQEIPAVGCDRLVELAGPIGGGGVNPVRWPWGGGEEGLARAARGAPGVAPSPPSRAAGRAPRRPARRAPSHTAT